MSKTDSTFSWDRQFFENKLNMLTNMQLGFVGAALMLMMMDLSRWYFLLPLACGLIFVSWRKQNLDKVRREIAGLEISMAPKSLLLNFTESGQEQRITFREISQLRREKRDGLDTIILQLKSESMNSEVLIRGLLNQEQIYNQLEQILSTPPTN